MWCVSSEVRGCGFAGAGNVRDEIVALLGLLETTEGHLGTGDELLGVLEVGELWGHR